MPAAPQTEIPARRTFPTPLKLLGLIFVPAALGLALRLVWEQTVWTWENGAQMVGFQLMHSGWGVLLILSLYAGLAWLVAVLWYAVRTRSLGGNLMVAQLAVYTLAWGLITTPYGFWQRLFIDKFTPNQAVYLMSDAAAQGDLRTVKAFLDHGIDINAQHDSGTALHGAAVQGELEVIEFLLSRGADVNAINAYGDSPMAYAVNADKQQAETQALLEKHGGKLLRGSEEQRKRVIDEQMERRMAKDGIPTAPASPCAQNEGTTPVVTANSCRDRAATRESK
jgi:hypothetical protein